MLNWRNWFLFVHRWKEKGLKKIMSRKKSENVSLKEQQEGC